MKNYTWLISVLVMLFFVSCSAPEVENYRDWEEELIGYGQIGFSPESMTKTFYYFGNRAMDDTKYRKIKDSSSFNFNGDTVTIANLRLVQMIPEEWWRNMKKDNNFNQDFLEVKDSSSFVISQQKDFLCLEKLSGALQIPPKLFLKMASKATPTNFTYLDYEEYNKSYVHFQYGLKSDSKILIATDKYDLNSDSTYFQYNSNLNHRDSLVVNSFLNVLIERRYQDKLSTTACSFPWVLDIRMVYNDSLFYFDENTIPFDVQSLVEYFIYQINLDKDKKMSALDAYPSLDTIFPLDNYPVAISLPEVPLTEIAR
ncbi:hypothetical protein SAMN05216474_0165 [Lishizhenia tianjinensis]|uniref:Lipoprotein n=1 Tax=Lishizhenia tianjinensis TaxID=477690 RepID=A0A1I6XG41_9FLAO|nr:hypothetical protein [Lishizhenia tianjinensis]SFT37107.1 hypothetical protein SAMN05216474_0165 [Lishizhenia tianjinensis]